MDAVSLVVNALSAGVGAGVKDSASDGVKGAYAALRQLVSRKLARSSRGQAALDGHEEDPIIWEPPLRKELVAAGAGEDPELVAAAEALMRLLDAPGMRAGKYVVEVHGSQGVQIGDGGLQINTFGAPPPR
jgi:hypothetical protein